MGQLANAVRAEIEGKLEQRKSAINTAKKVLGKRGRLVVRPSGTEPLIRVMAEGEDESVVAELAKRVAEVIREQLS